LRILIRQYGIEKLLSVLFAADEDSSAAWEEFLGRYSKLILKVCWKYEHDRDTVMQRYLYVCEKLAADNFSLLKKYDSGLGASSGFASWLIVVVRRFCIDFYRERNGRPRYPAAVSRLSKEDKLFFSLYYWKGLSLGEIEEHMYSAGSPAAESAGERLRRINSLLVRTPQRKPRIQFVAFNEEIHVPENDDGTGEEYYAELERMMSELPSREKIVVRLRFWEGLTAREIAQIMGITPYNKVYSILEKSLSILREKTKKIRVA
jgi:DNA-directed RNA polymerase specialized sigma24 family protein